MASASVIRAAVSSKILNKVDRFFSNRLSGIFIELVQNARRAGASEIAVSTETTSEGTRIVFEDNGAGIDDFSKLLHLGDSNWDAENNRIPSAYSQHPCTRNAPRSSGALLNLCRPCHNAAIIERKEAA